jgi:hypothetical protein
MGSSEYGVVDAATFSTVPPSSMKRMSSGIFHPKRSRRGVAEYEQHSGVGIEITPPHQAS